MPVKSTPRSYSSPARSAAAEETRARLIAAAHILLAGGEKLPPFSLDNVAKQAGVTRLTVYNQFESKRGLLEAVFDDMAQRGGLRELPSVLAEADADKALRRFVSVFIHFWSAHETAMPKFDAAAAQDSELASSMRLRRERRRQALTVLVKRLLPDAAKPNPDLVDTLFALTGVEMFESLSARNRSPAAVEALVQELVEQTVKRYRGKK